MMRVIATYRSTLIPTLVPWCVIKKTKIDSKRLKDLVRQPLYISETASSSDTLLRSLQRTLAIVVDEFGNLVAWSR
jgi:magnesium and cobalt transporter